MPSIARRDFLRAGLAGSAGLLAAPDDTWARLLQPDTACPDPFAGGRLLGTVPLQGRRARNIPVDQRIDTGLDARQFTDLTKLRPDRLVTPSEEFFVRTSYPDRLVPPVPWTIGVGGLVSQPRQLSMPQIEGRVQPMGVHLLECAGNADPATFGLMSTADWDGVAMASVLEEFTPLPEATRVLVSGVDEHSTRARSSSPGAAWIFALGDLEKAGAFLATRMNGAPLTPDHGHPVRLVVPGWFACTAVKWVDEITFLDDTAPATSQMREFAGRTHQNGIPALAKDFIPAFMDQAAMPVRIERWQVGTEIVYRVVGILWGGAEPTTALSIRFRPREPWQPVDVCPAPTTNATWSLWTHVWRPVTTGRHEIVMRIDDPAISTRRLDLYFYTREVWID